MLKVRTLIVYFSKFALMRSLTVSIRYSAIRRQFRNISGQKEETLLLDYQTQQMKLFPLVAKMFAHSFFSEHLWNMYKQMLQDSKKSEFKLLDESTTTPLEVKQSTAKRL